MKTAYLLDDFTLAYIQAALWSSNDESTPDGGVPMDQNYSIQDLAPEALDKIVGDCRDFQLNNAVDLAEAYSLYVHSPEYSPQAQAGHDFWLTRNGHGAGFWDRDIGDVGDRLTEACDKVGEVYLYVGDDGKIYCE